MSKPYQLLIFDWDGTVADSMAYISNCFFKTAADLGLEPPTHQQVYKVIGLSLEISAKSLFPDTDVVLLKKIIETYRQHFYNRGNHEVELFPGAKATLDSLKEQGYWLAVATGKSRRGLNRDLEEFKLTEHFICTKTADEAKSKPHPQMLEQILDETGLTYEQCLMIGDSSHDILMAQAIDMDCVLAVYGAVDQAYIESLAVNGTIDTISALIDWLDNR